MTDTLWQSFANASRAALEAEALHAAFDGAIADGALGSVRLSDEDWDWDSWEDENDWVTSYAIWSIRIREAGVRGAARGTLSVAVSFFRPEDRATGRWPGSCRAKLYVGVAPTLKAWNVDTLVLDGSGRSEVAEPSTRYRWHRTGTSGAWFFCVELARIDGREALEREVLNPLTRLLTDEGDEEAFAGCTAVFEAIAS